MITYAEACAAIAALPRCGSSRRVPLAHALGRVLAEDVRLGDDQPPFDRTTMDGFAVMLVPGRTAYRVVGTVAAGQEWPGRLEGGDAVHIMTGAPCPPGATVVPREVAQLCGDTVSCEPAALVPGANIAWRGEDGHRGDVVVPAGTRLGPMTVAAVAMCGAVEVAVWKEPRVAIITTGDEVGGSGAGRIHDTNGPFLEAFLQTMGCPYTREHIRDEQGALDVALARACAAADIVITTGGVSGSATDLVPGAAAGAGFVTIFHQIMMQPGKPVMLARHREGQLLVALPGNAVSVISTAHLVFVPVLMRWLGGWRWPWQEHRLCGSRRTGKRQQFLPARLSSQGVVPMPWNGSGDLIAAAAGHGLVDLPPGVTLPDGAPVRFLPYVGGGTVAGAGAGAGAGMGVGSGMECQKRVISRDPVQSDDGRSGYGDVACIPPRQQVVR